MTSPPKLTAIVAATITTLGIGHAGSLPWRLKSEMSYFTRVTKRVSSPTTTTTPPSPPLQNAVIMGRKTWDSLPPRFRPLPDRINIILSRNASLPLPPNVFPAASLDAALELLQSQVAAGVDKVFVIGGAEIYRAAMEHPSMENVLLTSVDGDFDCDTFFPVDVRRAEEGWEKRGWEELCRFVGEEVPRGWQEEKGVRYEFELYQRTR
ncbi:hypothetical protein RUND412_008310 [Rhizina undulata]